MFPGASDVDIQQQAAQLAAFLDFDSGGEDWIREEKTSQTSLYDHGDV